MTFCKCGGLSQKIMLIGQSAWRPTLSQGGHLQKPTIFVGARVRARGAAVPLPLPPAGYAHGTN